MYIIIEIQKNYELDKNMRPNILLGKANILAID
jgi:hypothetical protein